VKTTDNSGHNVVKKTDNSGHNVMKTTDNSGQKIVKQQITVVFSQRSVVFTTL
jgi:hypothetical protein